MSKYFNKYLLSLLLQPIPLIYANTCPSTEYLNENIWHLIENGILSFNGKFYGINPNYSEDKDLKHQIKNVDDLKLIFPNRGQDRHWIEKIDSGNNCRYAVARLWNKMTPKRLMGAPTQVSGGFMNLVERSEMTPSTLKENRKDQPFVPINTVANFTVSPKYQPKSLRILLESGANDHPNR